MASVPKEMRELPRALQTLVQPDVPPDITPPQELPIPAALLWSAPAIRVAKISAIARLNTNAMVSPSLHLPNHELDLSDISISATSFTSDALALPVGTTSPVVVNRPAPVEKAPEMWSNSAQPPEPATVISVSKMQMQEGTIALPAVNQAAAVFSADRLSLGREGASTLAGSGEGDGSADGDGAREKAPGGEDSPATASESPRPQGASTGSNTAPAQTSGAAPGNGLDDESAVSRIRLSKDGKFGIVVVGSSLAEQYPETQGLWGGRLAYSVYVHVGLEKNWILQYSLPRSVDAAAAGEDVRPDAPWPFDIVVPHKALRGLNANALVIHGFVNIAGRFEQLAVVSPRGFAQEALMLSALREWQFRPAGQRGRSTAVEVLLIIPETAE
jgi:hypothetical protein